MIVPLGDAGIASGLLCGFGFGYVLEHAGFGNARKLTGQFELRDWSLFKVMFPAIVIAATGLQILQALGLLDPDALSMPPGFMYATFLGGMLVGCGFVIGGYCPGTSIVALASGCIDGLFFIMGFVAGSWLFSIGYEFLKPLALAGGLPPRQTLPQLLGLSPWMVLAVLAGAAWAGFVFGTRMESGTDGPATSEID